METRRPPTGPSSDDNNLKLRDLKSAWALNSLIAFIGILAGIAQLVDFVQSGKLSIILLSLLGIAVVWIVGVVYLLRKRSQDQPRSQVTPSTAWSVSPQRVFVIAPRWAFVITAFCLIFSVLALVATVAVTGLFQRTESPRATKSAPPGPSTSDGVPPTSCPPAGQPTAKQGVVISLVEPSYQLTVGPAFYKAKLADKVQLEAGGQLYGNIPSGTRLFLLEWSDPTTVDSTPGRNPGNGFYYRAKTLLMWGDCWLFPQRAVAYDGAHGITFRQLLVLVDDGQVASFTAAKYDEGYSDQDLDSLGVIRLGYFDVPTNDLE